MSNNNEAARRLNVGRRAGIVGICANILLFALKIGVGVFTGSVSVIADAINNLSDAGSSVFVFVGYVLSSKPADKEHPYGHARMEHLCGLFISVIITVLGIELLRDSAAGLLILAAISAINSASGAVPISVSEDSLTSFMPITIIYTAMTQPSTGSV